MNTRIATLKSRIAYLRKALEEEMKKESCGKGCEADGASTIRAEEDLPPPPAEIKVKDEDIEACTSSEKVSCTASCG